MRAKVKAKKQPYFWITENELDFSSLSISAFVRGMIMNVAITLFFSLQFEIPLLNTKKKKKEVLSCKLPPLNSLWSICVVHIHPLSLTHTQPLLCIKGGSSKKWRKEPARSSHS